jgi:hypothetical protein
VFALALHGFIAGQAGEGRSDRGARATRHSRRRGLVFNNGAEWINEMPAARWIVLKPDNADLLGTRCRTFSRVTDISTRIDSSADFTAYVKNEIVIGAGKINRI